MLGIPWTARRTNASILTELKIQCRLSAICLQRILSYFGHVARREPDNLEKRIMVGMVDGGRGSGHPPTRWVDTVKKACQGSTQYQNGGKSCRMESLYYVGKCVYTRYVRIQDKYGCEMCTCIYEKSMMLCTPFECKDHGLLAHELDPMTYNDYVLGVPTHFSEYKCDPGQVIEADVLCECKCVRRDILSCPLTCQLGRPLN
ncbi:uncharacterized protein LOC134751688 [Cydia strobilella]|uniref:uncharacterized protein LOC134751688 n=1 Tax=Cydia strobilella TaxID=1100964 RepID=UPI0030065EDB